MMAILKQVAYMTRKDYRQQSVFATEVELSQLSATLMKRSEKIIIVGYVWNSRQNGIVLDIRGVSHCFTIGQHSGVEPKIRVVYETD